MPSKKGVKAKTQSQKAQASRTGSKGSSATAVKEMQLDFERARSMSSLTSTEAGSPSSSCSSPVSIERLPLTSHTKQTSDSRCHSSRQQQTPSDLLAHIWAMNKPLWMDNGLKGDKAAWLLVRPKVHSDRTSESLASVLKSPKDATLLGPYVSMKNTFLDESRVHGAVQRYHRRRAQSWDAGCSSVKSSGLLD